jgi:hypothetical protein
VGSEAFGAEQLAPEGAHAPLGVGPCAIRVATAPHHPGEQARRFAGGDYGRHGALRHSINVMRRNLPAPGGRDNRRGTADFGAVSRAP